PGSSRVLRAHRQRLPARPSSRRDRAPPSIAGRDGRRPGDDRRLHHRASRSRGVPVLLPPTPGDANALVALLGGGEAWSTSALAAALCRSQRAIQRALGALEAEGRVQAIGRGRARRWMAPGSSGFATTLLLAPTKSTG